MARAIKLVETRNGCAILETHSRFDVLLHGKKIGQLYFNMRGYTGACLPQPSGVPLDLGERGISAYRKAVAQLNREWAEADNAANSASQATDVLIVGNETEGHNHDRMSSLRIDVEHLG